MCHYIFSQVEDLPQAILIATFIILADVVSLPVISSFFEMDAAKICATLGCLASVVNRLGDKVVLLHSSLADVLFDEARSGVHRINPAKANTRLCVISLTKLTSNAKGRIHSMFNSCV